MAATTWTSSESTNNPIKYIQKTSGGTKYYVKCPSGYSWNLEDISSADAGRTQDGKMHKERLTVGGEPVQGISLNLEWQNLSFADGAGILSLFQPEYLFVTYIDALTGATKTKEFYVGNRSAPMYNCAMQLWSAITFNLISRN